VAVVRLHVELNVVKVLSGDSLVIRAASAAVPPPERSVSIAHLTAPRLGRRGNKDQPDTKDEVASS
jgi:hypothetical protein